MADRESVTSGNTEEDWKVFEILVGDTKMDGSETSHDMTTALKSEVAALQYKRDRLVHEINDMKSQLRSRDSRVLELQVESDQLREQSARMGAVIDSLKKRIKELEDRERELYAKQGHSDVSMQTLQRDLRYHEDRAKDLEGKLRHLEVECQGEEQKKEAARNNMHDLVRRLAVVLGVDCCDGGHLAPESVVLKATEIVQVVTCTISVALITTLSGARCPPSQQSTPSTTASLLTRSCMAFLAASFFVVDSLKKRIKELEDRERELYAKQGHSDVSMQTLQRDLRYHEDRAKDLEGKLRHLEVECQGEEQKKEAARNNMHDLVRRLAVVLGVDCCEGGHLAPESVVIKATEIVQETTRLKSRTHTMSDSISGIELELRSCKASLDSALIERDNLHRQSGNQVLEIERLRQEKDAAEMHARVVEREASELRDKLASSTRSLGSASGNIVTQEATICQLRDDLKLREEKCGRLQNELRHLLESLAIQLSAPSRFVESHETSIKERIREILAENKDKAAHLDTYKEKLMLESQQVSRQNVLQEQATCRIRTLEDDKNHLESKIHKLDAELNSSEISRDGLKRDKSTFMAFMDRLGRALNMDEISAELGVDMHTESLLVRAEQLARLESDKLVDKTSTVYQLQRRVRTLREQVQRKDLHLDLLRRKLALQEDNTKVKTFLQSERDEANLRVKKLLKQVERLQIQLSDSKAQCRDLNSQLAEAADYKITALERGRKVEELQKRLVESEMLRTRYNRKVSVLKDQVRATGCTVEQERTISEHSLQMIRDELARVKDQLSDMTRRESALQSFKASVAKILGVALPMPDYELISRLQKLVDAHHDFTLVSRRYDDPVLRLTARSPTGGSRLSRTPDRSVRYDDSGYMDAQLMDDDDDDLYKRGTRPI